MHNGTYKKHCSVPILDPMRRAKWVIVRRRSRKGTHGGFILSGVVRSPFLMAAALPGGTPRFTPYVPAPVLVMDTNQCVVFGQHYDQSNTWLHQSPAALDTPFSIWNRAVLHQKEESGHHRCFQYRLGCHMRRQACLWHMKTPMMYEWHIYGRVFLAILN